MDPLHREREAPTCTRCGKPIANLKDHDSYIAKKVGLTPGNYDYVHTACLSPAESQDILDNLR
mgnify:CR=1 FL=1